MKYKLIVMDMDGTLLNSQKQISSKTKNKLISLEKKGIRLVLASGRMKSRLEEYAKELRMDEFGGFIVEANGVSVYDFQTGEHTDIGWLAREEGEEIFSWLKEYCPDVEIAVMGEEDVYSCLPKQQKQSLYFNEDNPDSFRNREVYFIESLEEVDDRLAKICVCADPKRVDEVKEKLAMIGDRYWYGKTLPTWLEIGSKTTNKRNGVQLIMNKLNLKAEEVLAFGDGENDLEMLKAFHGVAMENALPALSDVIEDKAGNNDEDGIALYLERIGY